MLACDAKKQHVLKDRAMRNACDSDSRCGLTCDASARNAKSLAMRVERCKPLRTTTRKATTRNMIATTMRTTNEWLIDWMNEWMNEGMIKLFNVCLCGWVMHQWLGDGGDESWWCQMMISHVDIDEPYDKCQRWKHMMMKMTMRIVMIMATGDKKGLSYSLNGRLCDWLS